MCKLNTACVLSNSLSVSAKLSYQVASAEALLCNEARGLLKQEYITPNQTSRQQQGAYEYQTKLTQANMSWSLLRTM